MATMDVDEILSAMRKKHGEESITTFKNKDIVPIERISSGILPLDLIIGGGWPLGRIIEIYGPESAGKSTVSLHAVKSYQEAGQNCAYIDAECAFDEIYADAIGVNRNKLLFSQPSCGEEALDIVEDLVRTGSVGLIIVDSTAALTPKKEIDGDYGDSNVGLHARLMSQAMRKLTKVVSASKCTVIFINQIRMKVGNPYGNPETTTGGQALRFYSSIRLELRKRDVMTKDSEAYGNLIKAKTVKNKTYPPLKVAEFSIIYGKGVDGLGALVDLGQKCGVIGKGGAWYTYNSHRFQGKSKLIDYLSSDEGKSDCEALNSAVRERFSGDQADLLLAEAENSDS